jgi:hypothetical protein
MNNNKEFFEALRGALTTLEVAPMPVSFQLEILPFNAAPDPDNYCHCVVCD